ncbi:MAG: PstA family ABC transporter permease, partial [Pseudomonadota bacterium]
MTEAARRSSSAARARYLKRRNARRRAETRFRLYGIAGVSVAVIALAALLASIIETGASAFWQHILVLDVEAEEEKLFGETGASVDAADSFEFANYGDLWRTAIAEQFPTVQEPRELRRLFGVVNAFAALDVRKALIADPSAIGSTVRVRTPTSDDVDLLFKGAVTDMRETRGDSAARLRVDSNGEGAIAFQGEVAARLRARFAAEDAAPLQLTQDMPTFLIEADGGVIKLAEIRDREARGRVMTPPAKSDVALAPGDWRLVEITTPELQRRIKDDQVVWARALKERGMIKAAFNTRLFTNSDSREPEIAGLAGAIVGSALVMIVTIALSFPVGVATAVYLEEYAPKNRLTDIIEVNINNLAAVPSIIFGLLGLAVLLNTFGMPRSAPIVGGIVLALMTLPTIIIAGRAALQAVPPSIRDAAIGVGASRTQAIFDHVLPLAMPGILTGAILGMARALGETAPLLMIGMVAFIADPPTSFTAPASVLPVQIF